MSHIVIDFEASALDNGFPVSVGIAASDGRMFYSTIRPHQDWDTRFRWSYRSQLVHGFTPEHLEEHGRSVHLVVASVKPMFPGATFMADSELDKQWLDELLRASVAIYTPTISSVTPRRWLEALFDSLELPGKVRRAIIEMRQEMRTHNALSDAASSIAADAAAHAWTHSKEIRACRKIFEDYKKRVMAVVTGVDWIDKYDEALTELSKR